MSSNASSATVFALRNALGLIIQTSSHVILVVCETWLLKRHKSVFENELENELLERTVCFWRKLEKFLFWGSFYRTNS